MIDQPRIPQCRRHLRGNGPEICEIAQLAVQKQPIQAGFRRCYDVPVNAPHSSFFAVCVAASLLAGALVLPSAAWAGDADVVAAKVRRAANGTYDFDVTVKSDDRGWDYFADAFEVLTPEGKVLGTRVLLHPHENEQPFTRDLYGVKIPQGVERVVIRARHKPKGYGGKTLTVELPK